MIATMSAPVEISAWKPAPFALKGETVFAVGDVHGCASGTAAPCSTASPNWPKSKAASAA